MVVLLENATAHAPNIKVAKLALDCVLHANSNCRLRCMDWAQHCFLLLLLVVINLDNNKSLWFVLFPLWHDRWVIWTVSPLKKIRPDVSVISHTEDMSRTKTANDAEGVSSAVCVGGHVVCLATCARVWISSQLLKTKPIVVSVYAKVCCGPYRSVFTCVRMLGERGECSRVAFSEQLSKTVCSARWFPTVLDGTTK